MTLGLSRPSRQWEAPARPPQGREAEPASLDQIQCELGGEMAFEPVCREDWLIPDRGAAALINGHQVAIFKLALDGRIVAVDNFDPFSESFVISRGLIGTKQGRPKVTSPIYKQSFYLDSGECLDDPSFRLDVFPVRTVGGMVEVAAGGEFETGSLHDPIPGCDACDPDV